MHATILHSSNTIMPSQPKSNNLSTKQNLRLTIGQKVMLCKIADRQRRSIAYLSGGQLGNMTALADWATRAFDLPRPPSQSSLYNILRKKPELLKLHEDTYDKKKIADPVIDDIDRALLGEFDKVTSEVRTVPEYGLIYRSKIFVEEKYKHLPEEKLPGVSKG